MFVVSFANLKSLDPTGDCMMPRAEVHIRAQASQGNITVLSHLKMISTEHLSNNGMVIF